MDFLKIRKVIILVFFLVIICQVNGYTLKSQTVENINCSITKLKVDDPSVKCGLIDLKSFELVNISHYLNKVPIKVYKNPEHSLIYSGEINLNSLNRFKYDLPDHFELSDLEIHLGAESTIVNFSYSSGSRDAEEQAIAGTVSTSSTDLELLRDGSNEQYVGINFPVNIPTNAIIENAFISLYVIADLGSGGIYAIQAEQSDNATLYSTANLNISNRFHSNLNVSWTCPDTVTVSSWMNTSNISALISQTIQRPGWVQGNNINFLFRYQSGSTLCANTRSIEGANSPILFIEYSVDSCSQNLTNTSWSDWQNMTGCLPSNWYEQNRSLITYDANDCGTFQNVTVWDYRNESCTYEPPASPTPTPTPTPSPTPSPSPESLTLTQRVTIIEEEFNMIAFVLLYAIFLCLGIYLLTKAQTVLGLGLIGVTIGMDFFLIQDLYTRYVQPNLDTSWMGTFTWIFGASFIFWIITKISMPILLAQKGKGV